MTRTLLSQFAKVGSEEVAGASPASPYASTSDSPLTWRGRA